MTVYESRMFPFITHTWNPIAGGCYHENGKIFACPYRCEYCWAKSLINKFKKGNLGKKYSGLYRIHERVINRKFKSGDFVAVQFMSDIGAQGIPGDVLTRVFDEIRDQSDIRFLLLTKSDKFYIEYLHEIPSNCVCGITMETDNKIPGNISLAPDPGDRLDGLLWLKCYYPFMDTFVSIEPIMKFTKTFIGKILKVEPWAVAVGYDNYKHKLPEPTLKETEGLISLLEKANVKVYRKNIREAWDQ